ncbi:MAG: class I SAM-dependent methyltransferase, partial [Rhodoplanes sp.]
MTTEQQVADEYRHGALERAILDAVAASGRDVERLTRRDLANADEYHLGSHAATAGLANDMGLAGGLRVLDIGAGIGGPGRYFAEAHSCIVQGIDLSDEYVQVATALTRRCGLADRVSFRQASALAIPFADRRFDCATLIHVGMNIADKAKAFAEVRRVLKSGGLFGVYDVMLIGDGEIAYPMPWAMSAATSFLETPAAYRALLAAQGFAIEKERDWRETALQLGRKMRERTAQQGIPPLGLHILMGPSTPQRMANVIRALEDGALAPIEIIARAL